MMPSAKCMRLEDVPPPLMAIPPAMAKPFNIAALSNAASASPGEPPRMFADTSSPTGKWYNQCKFTCKACPEEKYFTVPQALRMHLNGIHSLSRKEYESRWGNAETITKYWTCLICQKELKCQKGIIIQHLLNVHTMELVDYERQYMDAGDQVVARENRKPRKNARVPLPTPAIFPSPGGGHAGSNDQLMEESPGDLSSFLVQNMQEGVDSVTLDGPVITEEVSLDEGSSLTDADLSSSDDYGLHQAELPHHHPDESVTSMSLLEVEGMDYVPWYFGCRYGCQICGKYWHYPQEWKLMNCSHCQEFVSIEFFWLLIGCLLSCSQLGARSAC